MEIIKEPKLDLTDEELLILKNAIDFLRTIWENLCNCGYNQSETATNALEVADAICDFGKKNIKWWEE